MRKIYKIKNKNTICNYICSNPSLSKFNAYKLYISEKGKLVHEINHYSHTIIVDNLFEEYIKSFVIDEEELKTRIRDINDWKQYTQECCR